MDERQPRTMKEIAFERIRERIVSGEWEGGTFLTERMLCELLGMSKTPIRSALDRLEMMGLVKLSPNQGIVVQEISLKKILEVLELRLPLETFAVRMLTGRLSGSIRAELERNLQEQERCAAEADLLRFVSLDKQFHELIVSGLDNGELNEVISRLQDKMSMVILAVLRRDPARLWPAVREHRAMLETLLGNDPDEAERLVVGHLDYARSIMIR